MGGFKRQWLGDGVEEEERRACEPKLHTTLVTLFYGTRGTSHRSAGFYLQCDRPVAWQGTAKGQRLQPVKTRRGNKFSPPRISPRPLGLKTSRVTRFLRTFDFYRRARDAARIVVREKRENNERISKEGSIPRRKITSDPPRRID